jgi:uncharacterized membrane protein YfcA
MDNLILLAIGLVAGVFAGMFGIGGGLIIVPALMYIVKVNQLQATGTSLAALIPPVGLLGALEYYRNGYMNVRFAALIAIGLFVGAIFGAKIMIGLPPMVAKRIYAIFLLAIGTRMLIAGK